MLLPSFFLSAATSPPGRPRSTLRLSSTTGPSRELHAVGRLVLPCLPSSLPPRALSTKGFDANFATTNPLGYLSLSIFNVSLKLSSHVRQQYAARHDGHRPTVAGIDVAFALHVRVLPPSIPLSSDPTLNSGVGISPSRPSPSPLSPTLRCSTTLPLNASPPGIASSCPSSPSSSSLVRS